MPSNYTLMDECSPNDDFTIVESLRKALLPSLEPHSSEKAGGRNGSRDGQHEQAAVPKSAPLRPSPPESVECTYLDYMGCTPYVDPCALARLLAAKIAKVPSTTKTMKSASDAHCHDGDSNAAACGSVVEDSVDVDIEPVLSLDPSRSLFFGNPHSRHDRGQQSAQALQELRARTLAMLTAEPLHERRESMRPRDVGEHFDPLATHQQTTDQYHHNQEYVCVFTSGATAGCKMVSEALANTARRYMFRREGDTYKIQSVSVTHTLAREERDRDRDRGVGGRDADSFTFVDAFVAHRLSHNSVLGMRGPLVGGGGGAYGTYVSEEELVAFFETLKLRVICKREEEEGVGTDENKGSAKKCLLPGRPVPAVLVAFPVECNMSGTVFDIRRMCDMIRRAFGRVFSSTEPSERRRLLIFCDGAAAFGKHPLSLRGTGVDFFTFSYYKAYGSPTGLGGLIVRRGESTRARVVSVPCPLALLIEGKSRGLGDGYFGGGSVSYVLPNTSHHAIKGQEVTVTVAGTKNVEDNNFDPRIFIDSETLCQGLEDGTPHFLGIVNALQWLRLVELFPQLLSPAAVGRRIKRLREYAIDRLSRLVIVLNNGNSRSTTKGILFMKREDCRAGRKGGGGGPNNSDSQTSSPLAIDGVHHDAGGGSSIAFRIAGLSGVAEGHTICESLLITNQRYKVALRAGGFCNPGACEVFLGVTEDDILSTFGDARGSLGNLSCPIAPLRTAEGSSSLLDTHSTHHQMSAAFSPAQCFDSNDVSALSGALMGCLRVSFGLYSTPRDVDRLVAALRDLGLEEEEEGEGEVHVESLEGEENRTVASTLRHSFEEVAKSSSSAAAAIKISESTALPVPSSISILSHVSIEEEEESSSSSQCDPNHDNHPLEKEGAQAVDSEEQFKKGKSSDDAVPTGKSSTQDETPNSEFYLPPEGGGEKPPSPLYRVHSLFVYPIKGCMPIIPKRGWPLGPSGLLYDRQWCIRLATTNCSSKSDEGKEETTAESGGSSSSRASATATAGRALVPKECIGLAALQPAIVVESASRPGHFIDLGGGEDVTEDGAGIHEEQMANVAYCQRRFLRIYLPKTRVTVMVAANEADDHPEKAAGLGNESSSANASPSALVLVRRNIVSGSRLCCAGAAAANDALSRELGMNVELIVAPASKGGEKKNKDTIEGGSAAKDGEGAEPPNASLEGVSNSPRISHKGGGLRVKSLSNFSNSGELLLITRESHEHVLDAIENKSDCGHVTLASYRPNIVIELITPPSCDGKGQPPQSLSYPIGEEGNDGTQQKAVAGLGRGEPYSELFWRSLAFSESRRRQRSPTFADNNRDRTRPPDSDPSTTLRGSIQLFSPAVILERREACLRCPQVGVDAKGQRILQQPLASIRQTCQRMLSSLPHDSLNALGVTRNSIAFGAIFSPVMPSPSSPPHKHSGDKPSLVVTVHIGMLVYPDSFLLQ